MEHLPVYQSFLDQLIAFATEESKKADLLAAKADYFKSTGEVFEDDKAFEMRMASFLDYFLFDRPSSATQKTPAQEFYEAQLGPAPEDAPNLRNFTETVHRLFTVKKISEGAVRLRDLFSGKDYDVTERRQLAGLEKGDIIEARLIPFRGQLLFSSSFCFHPKEASKAILKEIKRLKKKEPDRNPRDFIWECAKRALKVDRYRQIPVEKLYDFVNPAPI